MSTQNENHQQNSIWLTIVAIFALVFGALTLFSGGSVLFGPTASREAAGDVVPFVLWFNFSAGAFYILAAVGIWWRKSWAFALSTLIAIATGLVAIAFVAQVIYGTPYEIRTVAALILRLGVWTAIATTLWQASNR